MPIIYGIAKTWQTASKSATKLVSFGNKLIKYGKEIFKRIDNRIYCLFARESTYRIIKTIGILAGAIEIVTSIGMIVQYLIDILDGRWDGYLDTSRFSPKFTLIKEY